MHFKPVFLWSVVVLVPIVFGMFASCTSSKKYYERGQYDMAIQKAAKKLRKNPKKEKEILTIEQAFLKANMMDNERINFLRLEGSPDIWDEIYSRYSKMKDRQQIVKSLMPLEIPSTGRMLHFDFVNYDEEIINAKRKAAEYFYAHGKQLLDKGDRENAKKAYYEFKRVQELYPNYQDIDDMLKHAKFMATLKVVTEPIPMHSRTLELSNEFFDNKINEFLGAMPVNEFVRFYTAAEAEAIGLEVPDHIIRLKFDDFVVGQVFLKEKETEAVNNKVVMAIKDKDGKMQSGDNKITICHLPPGKPENKQTITIAVSAWKAHQEHGDQLGACNTTESQSMEVIYGTAKATVHLFTKTVTSAGLLDFQVYDPRANRVLTQEKFPGQFVWTCQWGNFNGDERALTAEQLKAVKGKEISPPPPQDLFIEFTKPIYDQLTQKVKVFYSGY